METKLTPVSLGQSGRVLVVDDEEKNRELLRDLLEARGHEVTEAADGEEALEEIKKEHPDVVLLDVMMPKMDGFDACRRIKEDPATAHIPVIIVTSLIERKQRLAGMDAGANDFLTKPIDAQDVALRVRNAIYTSKLYEQVVEQYARLKELEDLRDNLTHMIVHDLRSPLTGMMGYLELIQTKAEGALGEKEREFLDGAIKTTSQLNEMISSLLDVSRLESGEMLLNKQATDISALVDEALGLLGASGSSTQVHLEAPKEPVMVSCDPDLIRRVVTNILGNSMRFAPKEGEVWIEIEAHDDRVQVSVADTGPGIPEEYHGKIFEKFGQVELRQEEKKYSTGLGLTFCKLAVEAHGGQIGVESEVGRGSTFWFELPI